MTDLFSYLLILNQVNVQVNLLPQGTFANYMAKRQAEGADLAHLKPPHINPPDAVVSLLTAEMEETIVVTKAKAGAEAGTEAEQVTT